MIKSRRGGIISPLQGYENLEIRLLQEYPSLRDLKMKEGLRSLFLAKGYG